MASPKSATEGHGSTSPTAIAPVLVGFDDSEGGRDALELARLLCELRGTRCVVATDLLYGPVSVHQAISDDADAEAAPLFEKARAALAGIEVETHVVGTRSPGRMLAECAEREHAGTLVVGSPHRGRVGRALLGSVAEYVLHHSPCEVVVAPHGYAKERHEGLRKIAVAVDGTEESKLALARAEDLAREAGARIQIIVAEDPIVAGVEAQHPLSAADVLAAAIDSVDPILAPSGKRIDPGWRQVLSMIANGIANACDADVDLLVAGSRKPSDRFLLGSVTKHLITEAPCPVLVVPHQQGD